MNGIPKEQDLKERPSVGQICDWLSAELHCGDFAPADRAYNGLQVGPREREVRKVAAAVDATATSFEHAASVGADLLLVHHGIFWGELVPVVGSFYTRLSLLFESGLSLFAAHLPLDAHSRWGNNAVLSERLGLTGVRPFGAYRGVYIGLGGSLPEALSLDQINWKLCGASGSSSLQLPFKPGPIRNVAVVSGAGGSTISQAAAEGYDLLVTGEIAHQHYHEAEQEDLSLLAIGHYYSEIGGVCRLLEAVRTCWPGVETQFIDLPTGL